MKPIEQAVAEALPHESSQCVEGRCLCRAAARRAVLLYHIQEGQRVYTRRIPT